VANPDGIQDLIEENFGILSDGLASLAGDLLTRAAACDDDAWLRAPAKPLTVAGSGPLDVAEKMIQLSGAVLLSGSRLEAAAELARIAVDVRLAQGQPMWRRDDAGPDFWLILDGEVELTTARGERLRAGPGHELGAIEALAKAPRWYDAVAAKPVRALRLPVADLLDVIEDQRDVGMLLMRELAVEILRLDDSRAA
jgi:CRP-like cAMP-binding protein